MSTQKWLSTACACVLTLSSLPAIASLIVPLGLDVGDKYHVIFVTSTSRDATSSNISDYDAFVQSAADAAGIGATVGLNGWLALGSTSTVDAISHLSPLFSSTTDVPIYNQNGELVSASFNGLWDGSLDNAVAYDENGNARSWTTWTGTETGGNASTVGAYLGGTAGGTITGASGLSDASWVNISNAATGATFPSLYALSQEITVTEVATVPLPAAAWLLGSGLLGMIGIGRRKKAA